MLCAPSPAPARTRANRAGHPAGRPRGHEFDLVFITKNKNDCVWIFAITGPPVEVGVTMYVLSISSVSEVLMVHSFLYISILCILIIFCHYNYPYRVRVVS